VTRNGCAVLAVITLTVGALATVRLASAGSPRVVMSIAAHHAPTVSDSAGQASATLSVLSQHFDAFLEPRIASDSIPTWLVNGSASAGPDSRAFVWALPSADGVCIEILRTSGQRAAQWYGTTSETETGTVIVAVPASGRRIQLVGFVDGNASIVTAEPGKRRRVVGVVNNTWTITTEPGIRMVTVRGASGRVRTFRFSVTA